MAAGNDLKLGQWSVESMTALNTLRSLCYKLPRDEDITPFA